MVQVATPDSQGNAPSGLSVGDYVRTGSGVMWRIVNPGTPGANYNPKMAIGLLETVLALL